MSDLARSTEWRFEFLEASSRTTKTLSHSQHQAHGGRINTVTAAVRASALSTRLSTLASEIKPKMCERTRSAAAIISSERRVHCPGQRVWGIVPGGRDTQACRTKASLLLGAIRAYRPLGHPCSRSHL